MAARPWVEAVALLTAHGLPTPPRKTSIWSRRPTMAPQVRFAIIPAAAGAKPLAFADLDGLARWIHRERGDQGLDLPETEDLELEGDLEGRLGVHIYTTDAGNDRDRNLGTAWLDGRGREALQAALRRTRPQPAERKAA